MGLRAGMKWVAREGMGVGPTRRFGRWIFARKQDRLPGPGMRQQFLDAAAVAVGAYAPAWARRPLLGRALGVWLLAALWLGLPALLVGRTVAMAWQRLQERGLCHVPGRESPQDSAVPGPVPLHPPASR